MSEMSDKRTAMDSSQSTEDDFQAAVCRARALVANLGVRVRELKKQSGSSAEIEAAVKNLLEAKKILLAAEKAVEDSQPLYTKCRVPLENLARRRSFFFPAFEIYGGTAGLYDWGPPGCALKAEVETFWRQHFVLAEGMLEISGPCLTPAPVLKTSGHVDRFCDLITSDEKTGEKFRADKYLEDWIAEKLKDSELSQEDADALEKIARQADSYSAAEMAALYSRYDIRSPAGNNLTNPVPFNLMFRTTIGPVQDGETDTVAYLRPETAQGIFVNFRRLLEFNAGKMPFAAAQLGLGFRNEIAPRNGLLRVREFQMAEIEHFLDPLDKSHPKFDSVADLRLPLYPRERQLTDGQVTTDVTLREAVSQKIIDNETLGYFIARTYLFLCNCGIQPQGLRFRQHLQTEMAHYASDCWDAEIQTSFGWVECVGHADRSAFDLTNHEKATKTPLIASRRLNEPKTIVEFEPEFNKPLLGPAFKKEQQNVISAIEALDSEARLLLDRELETTGAAVVHGEGARQWTIKRPMVKFVMKQKRIQEETFIPSVVEPSFGIGRIIYAILEHTFRIREHDQDRVYLALPPRIAPLKCSLLTLSSDKSFEAISQRIKNDLVQRGVTCKIDQTSASIGKRYARTDEIGIPFGITMDFQSLKDDTVTLRERDSMAQVRLPATTVAEVVQALSNERVTWEAIAAKFPAFSEQQV